MFLVTVNINPVVVVNIMTKKYLFLFLQDFSHFPFVKLHAIKLDMTCRNDV